MGLYRRGRTWWHTFYVGSERVRESLGTRDKRAAEIAAGERLRRAAMRAVGAEDPFQAHRERPIKDHLADFETRLRAKRVSPSHQREVLGFLRAFCEHADVRRLGDLEASKAEDWLASGWERRKRGEEGEEEGRKRKKEEKKRKKKEEQKKKGWSHRGVNKRVAALKSFGRWLVNVRRWSHNPFVTLAKLSEAEDQRYARRALELEELVRLLEVAPLERRCLWVVAGTTGLRRGELAALTWAQVDLTAGVVRVRASQTKNGQEANQPLHPLAQELLKELLKARKERKKGRKQGNYKSDPPGAAPGDRVFDSVPRVSTLHRDLKRAGIDPGTPDPDDGQPDVIDLHALRSTFATLLARANVPLTLAQRLLRHSDPRLTANVYTRLQLHDARGAVAALVLPASVPTSVPTTGHNQGKQSTSEHHAGSGDTTTGRSRKSLRRGQLCPIHPVGIEPTTYGLEGRCSIR